MLILIPAMNCPHDTEEFGLDFYSQEGWSLSVDTDVNEGVNPEDTLEGSGTFIKLGRYYTKYI